VLLLIIIGAFVWHDDGVEAIYHTIQQAQQ